MNLHPFCLILDKKKNLCQKAQSNENAAGVAKGHPEMKLQASRCRRESKELQLNYNAWVG